MKKIRNKQNKIPVIGALFIVITFSITIIVLSQSYALEGFGQLNLSCDKTSGVGGEEISCLVTGTVGADSQVSALSSQIELSENLEFVSFTTNDIWEGNGDDGNIQLYTDENKSSTFDIGTFKFKVKEGKFNTTETITLKDNYLYDELFEEHEIIDTNIEFMTPQFSSNKYKIDENYILVNDKKVENIINNINTTDCNVVVEKDGTNITTGDINNNTEVKIVAGDKVLKKLDVVYVNSSIYDLSKGYIFENTKDISKISSNVELINSSAVIKNEKLVISYNNSEIVSYDVIVVNSDKYNINLKDNYIVSDTNNSDTILDNITISDNASMEFSDNKFNVIYKEEVVKSLELITISSDLYKVNLNSGYIYIGTDKINNDILENIDSTGNLVIDSNKLKISYNDKEVLKLDIINISSDVYLFDVENSYVYTKNTNSLDDIKENSKIVNSTFSISNNSLKINYGEEIVDEFAIKYFSTSHKLDGESLYLKEEIDYNTFISGFTFNGLSYKVYNEEDNLVTSGTIKEGYSIKLYNDSTELDTINIVLEYLEINNLDVNEEDSIIYNLKIGTTYEKLISNIDTSGEISILDSDGEELELTDVVRTRSVISIDLGSKNIKYKLSVLGDLTADGVVTVGDVSKLYSSLRGKITLSKVDFLAGDVSTNDTITVGDVSKLYSYLKGKIPAL